MKKTYKNALVLFFILILLIAFSAFSERSPWDCPGCGRKGNTGNFCGGCAYPAPKETESGSSDFSPVKVGDIIKFGHYEQDNNTSNGPEEIEWQVLDVQDGKALILSKYILDVNHYTRGYEESVTWETCTLRAWLNNDFLKKAFSAEEKKTIVISNMDNSSKQKSSNWEVRTGKNTEDQIFLLSFHEAEKYFSDLESRRRAPTAYAIGRGAIISDKYKTTNGDQAGNWWLRSPYPANYYSGIVSALGILDIYSWYNTESGIVPALWIDLGSYVNR